MMATRRTDPARSAPATFMASSACSMPKSMKMRRIRREPALAKHGQLVGDGGRSDRGAATTEPSRRRPAFVARDTAAARPSRLRCPALFPCARRWSGKPQPLVGTGRRETRREVVYAWAEAREGASSGAVTSAARSRSDARGALVKDGAEQQEMNDRVFVAAGDPRANRRDRGAAIHSGQRALTSGGSRASPRAADLREARRKSGGLGVGNES